MGLFRKRRKQKLDEAAVAVTEPVTSAAAEQSEATRREVAAEQRPDPDQPGWGRIIGGDIGKARQSRPSQD
jgi:hypothetical protein